MTYSREELEELYNEVRRRSEANRVWNFEPHVKQQIILDLWAAGAEEIIVLGGNRTGKTEIGAVIVVRECLRSEQKWWIICPSFSSQKDTIQEKIDKFLPKDRIKKIFYHQHEIYAEIQVINDEGTISTIIFHSYEQGREKLQGAGLTGVWFDEEPPQSIYIECRMRQKAGAVMRKIITCTPLVGARWLQDKSKGENVVKMLWADNVHLSPEQIQSLRHGLSQRELAVREYGDFAEAIGRVIVKIPPVLLVKAEYLDKDWWDALDPGYGDPTGYVLAGIDPQKKIVVTDCWGESGLGYTDLATKVKRSRGSRTMSSSIMVYYVPRLAAELAQASIPFTMINKRPEIGSWHEYLALKANYFFEHDLISFEPGTEALVEQLENLFWFKKKDEQTMPDFDLHRRLGHHFDIAIAFLYLLSRIHERCITQEEKKLNHLTHYPVHSASTYGGNFEYKSV